MKTQPSILIFTFFIFHFSLISAQGIRDSVFEISGVEVFAEEELFVLEEAGMQTTQVDTLVLQKKSGLSLSSLLSENTPIFIKSQGRGALATASFRGTAASHTQVNWNGMNINSPMLGSVDFSQIPVYLIDDISLKHGTSSMADQSGGLGGAIHINNQANWDNTFSAKYQQGIGSYSTYDEFLSLSFGNKKIQSKTRIYHNYSKNDYSYNNRSNPEINYANGEVYFPLDTNTNADYKLYGLLQEVYLRAGNRDVVSLKYWGQHSERSLPEVSSYDGPENNNLNRQNATDHKVVGAWKHYGKQSKLTLNSGYTNKDMTYEQQYLIGGQGLSYTVHSFSTQHSWYNSGKYRWNINSSTIFNASFSGNYHKISTRDTVAQTGYKQDRLELSAFAGIQKQFFERLNTNVMLRQDMVKGQDIPITPFFGFDYRLRKEVDLILKGNLSHNHHLPSLNDLYWQPGGNADLNAEEGLSSELGLEFKHNGDKTYFFADINGYYSDIDNWILWVQNVKGYREPQNVQNVVSKGIEMNARLEFNIRKLHYRLMGNYAYTKAINYDKSPEWESVYGKQMVYIPEHSANLMFNINYKNWNLTWQHNSYSLTYTTTSNDVSNFNTFPAYFMNDLTLSKSWTVKDFAFSGEVRLYNLFDENYYSAINHPMPGRNYMLLLAIEF